MLGSGSRVFRELTSDSVPSINQPLRFYSLIHMVSILHEEAQGGPRSLGHLTQALLALDRFAEGWVALRPGGEGAKSRGKQLLSGLRTELPPRENSRAGPSGSGDTGRSNAWRGQ